MHKAIVWANRERHKALPLAEGRVLADISPQTQTAPSTLSSVFSRQDDSLHVHTLMPTGRRLHVEARA